MTEPLPSTKRRVKHVPLLIFSGSSGAAYRWASAHGYTHSEYRHIRHAGQLDGLNPGDFFVARIAEWNLNHDVAQAWGLYLERCKKCGVEAREVTA